MNYKSRDILVLDSFVTYTIKSMGTGYLIADKVKIINKKILISFLHAMSFVLSQNIKKLRTRRILNNRRSTSKMYSRHMIHQ